MHTLAGPGVGAQSVVRGTIGALGMSSDRQVIGARLWQERLREMPTVPLCDRARSSATIAVTKGRTHPNGLSVTSNRASQMIAS